MNRRHPGGCPAGGVDAGRRSLPFVQGRLTAGTPSPVDDFLTKRHDRNELLIKHPRAPFFWQTSGQLMPEVGMDDGVILVADRALKPRHGCIVVAQVDNDLTVKTLHKRAHRVKLVPLNPTFPEIAFREG
ncbi:S24 family peptidase [Variovorax sp. RTB1]|uniref:S24 family peptidase n=1 Tax=Variovorax sp. RTB1 TaxID=3048631 RepID=UPI002B236D85|nr:S24 family peptidase [Variovorax sp. RTB1]MEB0113947.1 S24 family peptidase [Variovorax sp. RTB1]